MTAAHNSHPSSCIFLLGFLSLANYPLWRGIFKNAQACLPPLCLLGPEETLPSHTVASLLPFHSVQLWPGPSFHIIQRSTRCWSLCPYKPPASKNFLDACASAMTVTLDLLTSSCSSVCDVSHRGLRCRSPLLKWNLQSLYIVFVKLGDCALSPPPPGREKPQHIFPMRAALQSPSIQPSFL